MSHTKKKVRIIIFLLFCLSGSTASFGQGLPGGGMGGNSRVEGKAKFIPLPYVNYSRAVGLTLGAFPMVMFNPIESDTLSPSSIAGALATYSTNGTWFGMAFGAFFFDKDNWRLVTAGGLGSINYQFYLNNPIDRWIPYNTQADFFYIEVKRRVYDKLYAGISYVYTQFETSTEVFPDTLLTTLHGLGFNLSLDRRGNIYYPRSGFLSDVEYSTYPKGLGNEFVSNKIEIDHNHYIPFREEQDVLAARFFAGLGIGDLSFNQQFIVGRKDIRGYTQGAFRGNYQVAIQGEYRWNFHKKWGAVGFLGFSTIFESINQEDDGKILPGVGTGIRYTILNDTQMKAGMDIAVGNGDWGVYFRIGEAF